MTILIHTFIQTLLVKLLEMSEIPLIIFIFNTSGR